MTDPEGRQRESWSENAAAWTDAVREGRIESRVLATDAAVLDVVVAGGPRRVLDVGCGEGWLGHRLAERGVAVVGFDASEALVRCAREGGAGEYHVIDYAEFSSDPLRLGSGFDAAVCNFSLLGEEIGPLLGALAKALVPAGSLIVQTLHPCSIAEAGYRDGWREEDFRGMGAGFAAAMPWYFRTLGSWVGEMRRAGFRLDECREPVHPDGGRPLSLLLVASIDPSPGEGGAPTRSPA